MKHSCKYHPGEQATWYCPVDGIHFSPASHAALGQAIAAEIGKLA